MGKLNSRHDLSRSKYLIVASCAAIAMILGALSVGAQFKPRDPAGNQSEVSQVYPIPVKTNSQRSTSPSSSSGSSSSNGASRVDLTSPMQNTLSKVSDWSKKALSTDPINLQVRVGLTQAAAQVNAFGFAASLPLVVNNSADVTTGPIESILPSAADPAAVNVAPTTGPASAATNTTPPSGTPQVDTTDPVNGVPPANDQPAIGLDLSITP